MTPEELTELINSIINNAVSEFNEGLEKTQSSTYNTVLGYIKQLDIDANGNVKKTSKNIRIVNRINKAINNEIITETYKNRVNKYVSSFNKIEAGQKEYFGKEFSTLSATSSKYLDKIKADTVSRVTQQLLDSGFDANLIEPLKDLINKNVTSGATFSDMVEEVRNFILGNEEIDGSLLRYTKQITADTLHIYSGEYNTGVAEDLGLKFVKYSGSSKDTTRDFCRQRSNKYYHKQEVKLWASLDWAGKMRGTTSSNIFSRAGGYHCRHLIIYVSEFIVPQSVKNRAKAKGYEF